MKKFIFKALLLIIAVGQVLPAHAMLLRLSQTALRFRILQFSNQGLPAATATSMPRLQTGSTLLVRALATQQNEQATGDSSRSNSNNNSHNNQNRWQKAFLLGSLATVGVYENISVDENAYIENEIPASETPEVSHVYYSDESKDSEKSSATDITEFEKFVRQFAPPEEVQRTIEANKEEIVRILKRNKTGHIVGSPSAETPDIFVKNHNINRIINAERMRECIRQNNLNKLAVPKKYIYKLDDQWIVVAEYIKPNPEPISLALEEVQQLAILAAETWYTDMHQGNIIRDINSGKITFIDLENRSFHANNPADSVRMLKRFTRYSASDTETKTWIKNHYKEISNLAYHNYQSLQHNSHYDLNLDFEKVREEHPCYEPRAMSEGKQKFAIIQAKIAKLNDEIRIQEQIKNFTFVGTCAVALIGITWWLNHS